MATTDRNIRIDQEIKEIPFALKLDVPNETTAAAIEEGRRIASDRNGKGSSSMDDLKAALEVENP